MKKLFFVALLVACHKDDAQPHVTAEPSAVVSVSAATSAPSAPPSADIGASEPAASASVSVAASASASASAKPAVRVACGTKTCAPDEFCLHYDPHSGGAYSPDKHPADATMCSKEIMHNGSMNCGPPNAARQAQCAAFIPRAPPHGGDMNQ